VSIATGSVGSGGELEIRVIHGRENTGAEWMVLVGNHSEIPTVHPSPESPLLQALLLLGSFTATTAWTTTASTIESSTTANSKDAYYAKAVLQVSQTRNSTVCQRFHYNALGSL